MQNDDEARSAARPTLPPLPLPSPEQFGLGQNARRPEVDWSDVRRRLESLSISSFHLQRVDGGFRFMCLVPTPDGKRQKVEAESEFEADAISQALASAERVH